MTQWDLGKGVNLPPVQVTPGGVPAVPTPTLEDLGGTTVGQLQADIQDNYATELDAQLKAEEMQRDLTNSPASQNMYRDPEIAKAAVDETKTWSAVETIGQSMGHAVSRSWTGMVRGYEQHELGIEGSNYRSFKTEQSKERIAGIKARLEGLGAPTDSGFVSYLESAAEILGQQYASWTQEDAGERLAAGMAIGTGIGLAASAPTAGTVAPITGTAGAIAGLGAGAVTHMMLDSFEVEGGLAYLDMVEMGIEEHISAPLSIGVGVINSSLEIVGALGITKPFTEAGKALVRKHIRKTIMSTGVQKLIKDATLMYGKGVITEVTTEVLQEMVNIGAEEMGKAFSDIDIEGITEKELSDRLTGVIEKTFKAMILLGAPGPGAYVAVNIQDAKQAGEYQRQVDALKKKLEESKLTVEQKADMTAEVLKDNNIEEVYIPAKMLQDWLDLAENPEELSNQLGVTGFMQSAVEFGQDLAIDGKKFAQYIVQSDRYEFIADHIRVTEQGMTPAEAEEYMSSGVQSDLEQLNEGIELQEEPDVQLAEEQLGLKAMFASAAEAGMTDKQYENYIRNIQRSRDDSYKHMKDLVLKQEQREKEAEWKTAQAEIEKVVRTEYEETPTYASINQLGTGINPVSGGQQMRLDKTQLKEIADELEIELSDLPKLGRQVIYTTDKKEPSWDVDVFADLYGYESAAEFVEDIATAAPMEQAIAMETQNRMVAEHGTLLSQRNKIIEARRAVQGQVTVDVLTEELNALRGAIKAKKLKRALVRQAASERMRAYDIKDVRPDKFEQAAARAGREAGKAQRAGEIGLASEWKFKQVINTEMARQAYEAKSAIEKKKKAMQKLTKEEGTRKIGAQAVDDIRQVLSRVRLAGARPKPVTPMDVHNEGIDPVKIPAEYKVDDRLDWRDMNYGDFEVLFDLVTEIAHKGRQADKLRDAQEKRNVARISQLVVAQINRTLGKKSKRDLSDEQERAAQNKKDLKDIAGFIYNADTILREMDGFEDLGVVYTNMKGRYDRAMSVGYREDQIGYLRRQKQEASAIAAIFDKHFTLREQKWLSKKIKIKGMQKRVSQHTLLSVLLNSGNVQNLKAIDESGQYTPAELQLIRDHATKRDWQFAQDIWDYFDSFWGEVHANELRRRGVRPKPVQAKEVKTKHGTLKGGYYPIRWQGQDSVFFSEKDMTIMADKVKFGAFATSQTQHGHTLMRTEGVGNPLDLNLYVINSHVEQVIYDLEMGDALNDFYKVLYDKDVKTAMVTAGARHKWDQLDLWLRDVIRGEIGASGGLERAFRAARTGVTVSKLGLNFGVAALQPLGLLHTAVQIGKVDTLAGLVRYIASPIGVSKFAKSKSGFMEERAQTYQHDINDAAKHLSNTWVNRALPGKTAEYIRASYFFFIRAAQALVDNVTWIAAYRQGMKKFDTDDKAVQHADRMVARSQASGILGERTPLERGTVSKSQTQKESIKIWTNFISYFMAKANIAVEQYKKTDFRNPVSILNFAINMALIFTVEAFAASVIRGQLPEDDEDDPFRIKHAASETAYTVLGSIPFIRGFGAELQGFRGGSSIETTVKEFGQAAMQIGQGEFDKALVKNIADAAGIWFKLPTGQFTKTGVTINDYINDKDVTWSEFLLGPQYGK
jgi:hypothetical protein